MNDFTQLAVMIMTATGPFLLAGLGTVIAGRAGVFLVLQEGLMALGAVVVFLVALEANAVMALLAAAVVGFVIGALMAHGATRWNLNQFVLGLALFLATLGAARGLFKWSSESTTVYRKIDALASLPIPGLSDIPVLGPVLFDQNALLYFALVMAAVTWWVLYRTGTGLSVRVVGENPRSADSLGISVHRVRVLATGAGCALIALGGAYLPLIYTRTYTDGIVAGRGWMVIALAFLGAWRPDWIVGGAIFFATMDALGLWVQSTGADIPPELLTVLPYVATIVVMTVFSRQIRIPAGLGENYDRESRTR